MEELKINGNNKGKFDYLSLSDIEMEAQSKAQEFDELAFPLFVFPASIRKLIEEAQEIVGFPKDFFAGGILAAASVAIGNSVQLRVRDTQIEAPVLYLALVGAPGINKTHPLNFAFKAILEKDKENYKKYIAQLAAYKTEIQNNKKDKELIANEPKLSQFIASDITTEALINLHSINKRGICYFRDELLGWINDLNRYRKGSDEQMWLSNFSRQPIKYDRKTGENRHLQIHSPFISVVGTIQTEVIHNLSSGDKSHNGFLDRILFIFPQNVVKSTIFNNSKIQKHLIDNYSKIIEQLLNTPYLEGKNYLIFSKNAYKKTNSWYGEFSKKYNNLQDTDFRKNIIPKIEIYTFRFAIILQMLHWADNPTMYSDKEVAEEVMQKAISLGKYFYHTAVAIREKINMPMSEAEEKKITVKQLKKHGFSLREIAEIFGVTHPTIKKWIET